MTRNFLICPSLAHFRLRRAQTSASPSVPENTTHARVSCLLFALASALLGGNFLLSQGVARIFA